MLVLVIIMIGTLVAPMIFKLNEQLELVFEVIDWIIWGAFAVELCKNILILTVLHILRKTGWMLSWSSFLCFGIPVC